MIIDYSSSHHYYIRDYQGCSAPCDASRLKNNRVAVAHNDTVEQQNDYYAYGGPWGNTSTNQGFQPFKYNGKELDRVHGLDWYDYGARRYDPAFAQFTQMDPLCEKYPHLSPYAYCAGNPVRYVDPDGQRIWIVSGKKR
jgi:RHS repeat-associated protein